MDVGRIDSHRKREDRRFSLRERERETEIKEESEEMHWKVCGVVLCVGWVCGVVLCGVFRPATLSSHWCNSAAAALLSRFNRSCKAIGRMSLGISNTRKTSNIKL